MKSHEMMELRWDTDENGKDSFGEAKLGKYRLILKKMTYDASVDVEVI